MGTHGFLSRAISLTTGRLLFNNRVSQVSFTPPTMSLKSDIIEKFKQLNIPDKPKKPVTPFIRFVQDNRPIITKENPHFKITDVVRKCARDWQTASQEVKAKYADRFKVDREEYDKKILKYESGLTKEQSDAIKMMTKEKRNDSKKRKIRKLIKESDKPKRPMLPYMRYLMEQSKIKNVSVKDMMTHSKGVWSNMSAEEKQKYVIEYTKDKEQYDTALLQWESKMMEEGHPELVKRKLHDKHSRIRHVKKTKPE